jgi:short-subunit dehydrogenase
MDKKIKDKVVIITGASSGIGLACAREFAARGCKVVMAARNLEGLEEHVKEIRHRGLEAIAVQTDVSIEDDCKKLIEKTVDTYGAIDVLINNAGISMRALFKDVKIEVIRKLMEINFFGTVYCSKYALPHLLKAKGSLVGMSSIAGFHGLPGRTGYSASKFAMHGFLETIRIEHLKDGLHVLIVAPGFTSTNVRKSALQADGQPQNESPRSEEKMMSPEEVARFVYKGIKYRRRNIILTLEGMFSVLAQRVVPHFLDRIFYYHMSKEKNSPFK